MDPRHVVSAVDLVPITPDDDTDLARPARAIRCKNNGTAGNVAFHTPNGVTRTTDIVEGETILIQVKRVLATGTTADGLEAML